MEHWEESLEAEQGELCRDILRIEKEISSLLTRRVRYYASRSMMPVFTLTNRKWCFASLVLVYGRMEHWGNGRNPSLLESRTISHDASNRLMSAGLVQAGHQLGISGEKAAHMLPIPCPM